MGEYYNRLTQVAHLDYDDSAEQAKYTEVLTAIADIRALAESFRSEPGMTGQTATAALAWLAQYEADLSAKEAELQTLVDRHELARAAMTAAKAEFGTLAPALLTPFESRHLAANRPFLVGGREVSGDTYVNELRAQRDAERDLAAKKILDAMNAEVAGQSALLHTRLPEKTVDAPGPSGGGSPAAPRRTVSPTPTGGGSGSGSWGIAPGITPVPGGTPTPAPQPDPVPGAPDAPAPVGPVTIPNGPTEGYVPPSVLDPDDPRWSDTYVPSGFPVPSGTGGEAGVIVGGMIGMGATALASRALANSALSGSSALALQAAAGSGNASALGAYGSAAGTAGRVPGGGMLSSPATANAARAGATVRGVAAENAAAAGSGGRGSSTAASGRSAGARAGRGSTTSATGNAAGARSARGSAGPLTTGAAAKGREKDKAKAKDGIELIGYDVQRLDAEAGPIDPGASIGAGSSAELGPVPDLDGGERW